MSVATNEKQVAAPAEKATIKQIIESDAFKTAISKVLPRHVTPERMARVALTALTRNPKLAQCDQASLFRCLMDLSQWGLEPDGRRAHLIPFENRKQGIVECQLIIDYKGIVELVMRSGAVSRIHADVVCENDGFEYDRGELKLHRVDFRKPRGAVYAVYCLIQMRDGTEKVEVLGREEVEAVRKRSRAGNSGPWVTDWNEMAKKTAFRRASKWVPLSAEVRDAIEVDDDLVESQIVSAPRRLGLDDLTDRLLQAPATDANGLDEQAAADAATELEGQPVAVADASVARGIYDDFMAECKAATTIVDVRKAEAKAKDAIGGNLFAGELAKDTIAIIVDMSNERIDQIKSTRGEKSNGNS